MEHSKMLPDEEVSCIVDERKIRAKASRCERPVERPFVAVAQVRMVKVVCDHQLGLAPYELAANGPVDQMFGEGNAVLLMSDPRSQQIGVASRHLRPLGFGQLIQKTCV